MRAQFTKRCSEQAALHVASEAKDDDSDACKEADEAGQLVQELVSSVESEEVCDMLLQVSNCLEKIHKQTGRKKQKGSDRMWGEGESEGEEEEETGPKVATLVAPPCALDGHAPGERGGRGK